MRRESNPLEPRVNNDLTFKNVRSMLKSTNGVEAPNRFQAKMVESHNTSLEMPEERLIKEQADR